MSTQIARIAPCTLFSMLLGSTATAEPVASTIPATSPTQPQATTQSQPELASMLEEKRSTLRELDEQIAAQQRRLEELQKAVLDDQIQQDELKGGIIKLELEIKQLKAEKDKLSEEASHYKAERDELADEIKRLSISLNELAAQQRILVNEVSRFTAKMSELATENLRLSDEKLKIAAEIGRLEELLRSKTSAGSDQIHNLIEIFIEGKRVKPGEVGILHEDSCRLAISVAKPLMKQGILTLADAGIVGFSLSRLNGPEVPISSSVWALEQHTIAPLRSQLCDSLRDQVPNHAELQLVVRFRSDEQRVAVFHIQFRRRRMDVKFDVNYPYLGAWPFDKERNQIAAYVMLRGGVDFQLPLDSQNKDFYLGINGFIGLGLTAASSEFMADSPSQPDSPGGSLRPWETVSAVVGASVALGKYVEVGFGRDVSNDTWLFLLSPSSTWAKSIQRF